MFELDSFVVLESALYLGEKNLPSTGPVFRVLRGELEPNAYAQPIRGKPLCCSGSSCEWEIHNIFTKLESGDDRHISEISLVYAFLGAASIIQDKRGSDNTAVEGLFPILRMLGLRPMIK